jgi:hypothetical protein
MRALERAVLDVRMPRKTEETIERRPSRSESRGGFCETRKDRTDAREVGTTAGEGGTALTVGVSSGVRDSLGRAREEMGRLTESGPADMRMEDRGGVDTGADRVGSEIVQSSRGFASRSTFFSRKPSVSERDTSVACGQSRSSMSISRHEHSRRVLFTSTSRKSGSSWCLRWCRRARSHTTSRIKSREPTAAPAQARIIPTLSMCASRAWRRT